MIYYLLIHIFYILIEKKWYMKKCIWITISILNIRIYNLIQLFLFFLTEVGVCVCVGVELLFEVGVDVGGDVEVLFEVGVNVCGDVEVLFEVGVDVDGDVEVLFEVGFDVEVLFKVGVCVCVGFDVEVLFDIGFCVGFCVNVDVGVFVLLFSIDGLVFVKFSK